MQPDLIIRNGTVFDGTGAPPVRADVVVHEDRVVSVGPPAEAAAEIDAAGLYVTPGFIDIHSHSDYTLLVDPRAVSALAQGVTLEVVGNCGFGCAPIGDPALASGNIYGYRPGRVPLAWRGMGEYLDRLAAARPAVNVLSLVPNGQLRLRCVGLSDQPAPADALAEMQALLREALAEGAWGYSTGLEYPPEMGAPEEEVAALAREAARAGALYATHTRARDQGAVEAVVEAIRTAARAEVRLQVSHLLPRSGLEDGRRAIELVEAARAHGQDVAFDMHTRLYGTTFLSALLPSWAREGGPDAIASRLRDRDARARIKSFRSILSASGDWERVVLLDTARWPEYARSSLAEIGRLRGQDPHDAALDLLEAGVDDLTQPMV
ncbi:MAG: amidohydrolase family protein, partial [Acetobacteraceae bacterium]|nr:amidohydrolase family protein [Acetobacteraceae bacterium]